MQKFIVHFRTRTKLNLIIESKEQIFKNISYTQIKKRSCLSTQPFFEVIYIIFTESGIIFIFHDVVLIDVLYGVYTLGSLNFVYYKTFFRHLYYAVFHRGLLHDHLLYSLFVHWKYGQVYFFFLLLII